MARRVLVPEAPALVLAPGRAVWLGVTGEIEEISPSEAARRLVQGPPPFVCHARAMARRLGINAFHAYDLLELYAFVRPAGFCLPTAIGLADALALKRPSDHAGEALLLLDAATAMLLALANQSVSAEQSEREDTTIRIAAVLEKAGWIWGEAVVRALGPAAQKRSAVPGAPTTSENNALAVWTRLKEWQDSAPLAAPSHFGVSNPEARARLAELLGEGAEARPQQADYASAVCGAFQPALEPEQPHLVLAEAGTGVGKTLGYIAPASLWAEKNEGTVWLSTFTRNLQRQIDGELDRLFPDSAVKADKVVVRKGRENYLCLLNLEEAVSRSVLIPGDRIAMAMMARWAEATRDGDMVGGDFPAWLADLFGYGRTLALTDRRGECIYSACPHYRKCYVEKNQRKARGAEIVIANHALVMVQAAQGAFASGERGAPTRFVFDEGHHVFGAADSAFSAHLTGSEARELRRWLMGAERSGATRRRGLRSRVEDLIFEDETALQALDQALNAARALPSDDWAKRVAEGGAHGPTEKFLSYIRQQVMARSNDGDGPYSLEAPTVPEIEGMAGAAAALESALGGIRRPLLVLAQRLAAALDEKADSLDSAQRARIEGVVRGVARRGEEQLASWCGMLQTLMLSPATANEDTGPDVAVGVVKGGAEDVVRDVAEDGYVDWFAIQRSDGRDIDLGMHRHFIDPTRPFAQAVLAVSHGALLTSATLRDGSGDFAADWDGAEARTGVRHVLGAKAVRAEVPSPFDYGEQTRIFIITDVRRNDADQVAAAYRELFKASGGGALGLFTAISRLRAAHSRIDAALDAAGLRLWAQHVDPLDTSTLVDIFRADEHSCLLGTDAVRDGVDVPGQSLRLIVFDRVPWPRPDILHKARKKCFGGARYDDMLTRLKLKQAYGRLVRRADDRGVFVMLDSALPSRLLGAFPPEAPIERLGLADAIAQTRRFLGTTD
ncbi:MAG: ATP-dependent DNA helicase [Proteobacteria bacterium]|nr:ATP-dependent DNA helicase [Pseudomonadota bacterium]MDA1355392.1 ATP-dependent DNA helicase [Pseudomonadota bacterium]